MTPTPAAIFCVTGCRGEPGLVSDFRGAVSDRVVRVPVDLVEP